jgi:hypothetical protein
MLPYLTSGCILNGAADAPTSEVQASKITNFEIKTIILIFLTYFLFPSLSSTSLSLPSVILLGFYLQNSQARHHTLGWQVYRTNDHLIMNKLDTFKPCEGQVIA